METTAQLLEAGLTVTFIGMSVVFAVSWSFVTALTITAALAGIYAKPTAKGLRRRFWRDGAGHPQLTRAFHWLLGQGLRMPVATAAIALLVPLAGFVMAPALGNFVWPRLSDPSATTGVARLEISGLLQLSNARQRNLLRYAIRRAGLPVPGAARLATIINTVLCAREDAQPLVTWQGAELRRYRGTLYLLPSLGKTSWPPEGRALDARPMALGPGMGTLRLAAGATRGLSGPVVGRGLSVRGRRGGEELKPAGQAPTKKLKKLLQDEGVVPWMRDRLPLVYAGDELVAVADLWLAADAVSEPGTAVYWDDRPELY